MHRVGVEVVLGFVAAVEDVSEIERRVGGTDAQQWAHGEVKELFEGDKGIDSVDHGVDLRGCNIVLHLEQHHMLDDV